MIDSLPLFESPDALDQLHPAGCDRTLLYASSLLMDPFCKAHELLAYRLTGPIDSDKFENYPIVQEIAFRALIVVGALFGLALLAFYPIPFLATVLSVGLIGKLLRAVAFALRKEDYTYVHNPEATELPLGERTTIAMQNFAGIEGGMHYDRAGVGKYPPRLQEFVEIVHDKKPHTIIFQEIYTASISEDIIRDLGPTYPHIFTHLGANVMGSVGGLTVLTDHPVDKFVNISFENNDWTLNRTFAVLEIGNLRIIATHLIHNSREKRKEQFNQILDYIAKQPDGKLTVICADFNIERDGEEGLEVLSPYLEHGYTGMEPTCTNKLKAQWDGIEEPEEVIDNMSQVKAVQLPDGRKLVVLEELRIEGVELIRAFDETYDTKKARSDHHCQLLTIRV